MKIAVCISGQIRTWRECYQNWQKMFEMIKESFKTRGEEVEIDVFIHTWNLQTIPPHVWNLYEEFDPVTLMNVRIPVSKIELNEMLETIKPKKYLVESYDKNSSRTKFNNDRAKKYDNEISLLYWTAPHLYSVMRSGQLKLDYEIENNFEYDVCIKTRFDLKFGDWDIGQIIEIISSPLKERTIHSVHSNPCDIFPHFIVGDIFYFSDSQTFNILTTFYNWLPVLKYNIFFHGASVEQIFTYYVRMFKINNHRTRIDPKVIRLNYSLENIKKYFRRLI